jgi:hypothetical protein
MMRLLLEMHMSFYLIISKIMILFGALHLVQLIAVYVKQELEVIIKDQQIQNILI